MMLNKQKRQRWFLILYFCSIVTLLAYFYFINTALYLPITPSYLPMAFSFVLLLVEVGLLDWIIKDDKKTSSKEALIKLIVVFSGITLNNKIFSWIIDSENQYLYWILAYEMALVLLYVLLGFYHYRKSFRKR